MCKIKCIIIAMIMLCTILPSPAYAGGGRITYLSYGGAEEEYTDCIPCDTALIKIYPGFNPEEYFNLFDTYLKDSVSVVADAQIYFKENAICIKPEKQLHFGHYTAVANYKNSISGLEVCENYSFNVSGYVFGKQREVKYYVKQDFSGLTNENCDNFIKLSNTGNYAETSRCDGPAGRGDAALLFEFSNMGVKEKNGPFLGYSYMNLTGRVVIEHDIKFSTTCDTLNYEFKGVGNSSNIFHFAANKQLLFTSDGFFQDTQIPYYADKWSHIKIIGDFNAHIWDVYYDGAIVYNNIPMENNQIGGIGIFRIYLGQSKSANEKFKRAAVCIDNLSIYTEKTKSSVDIQIDGKVATFIFNGENEAENNTFFVAGYGRENELLWVKVLKTDENTCEIKENTILIKAFVWNGLIPILSESREVGTK